MAAPRRATISDVARAAGVSRQTVSRAMNDMAEISPATRTRVLAVARELRYRPSRFGRGLAKPEQATFGLLIDDLTNPYYPELAAAVVRAAAGRGWNVVLADAFHASDHATAIRDLAAQVDVVLGYASLRDAATAEALHGVPFVRIGADEDDDAGIVLDATSASAALVEHLVATGVRAPAVLATAPGGPRTDLFADLLRAAGLPVTPVLAAGEGADAAQQAVVELIASGTRVDAVVAFNDLMACGVLKALARSGVAVPQQVRVTGVDGLSLGAVVTPELTTLAIDMDALAVAAVDLGVGMFDGDIPESGPQARRRLEYRLLLRASA